jgi:tRNA(adenine34) deaminase
MEAAFTKEEKTFMSIALKEAGKALLEGDYPIGAVLAIDGNFIDKARNSTNSQGNWYQHAEAHLILKNSQLIKKVAKTGSFIELFTTLEPCLMCMGISVLHRVNRITFACPDPHGGAGSLTPENINGEWYKERWPEIRSGLYLKESYRLMKKCIKAKTTSSRDELLKLFKQIQIK